jgi:hypothetical protein
LRIKKQAKRLTLLYEHDDDDDDDDDNISVFPARCPIHVCYGH